MICFYNTVKSNHYHGFKLVDYKQNVMYEGPQSALDTIEHSVPLEFGEQVSKIRAKRVDTDKYSIFESLSFLIKY